MRITGKIRSVAIILTIVATGILGIFTFPINAEKYRVGDIITFGTYEQDNNRRDGAEDIEWIVLDQRGNQVMLISKYCLDSKPYHDTLEPITWEHCSLREWLNDEFYDTAFSTEEQERIIIVSNENNEHDVAKTSSGRDTIDWVSILSKEEAEDLFATVTERIAAPTEYAKARGSYLNPETRAGWWWLRTNSFLSDHVTYATSLGGVSANGREVTRQDAGVRPVIWITAD